ncbi:hypothetical protein [Segatella salivae]|uniref:Uncharacterized protein n=1 Tax=Segatella salivae DSM 15606 TaxID=888832 RepID=E6MKP5_9BACT|nr:hypothetical protein [Segatella salivae]EFV05801.1 hypothetical protein HMPREF9420_0062 [Segatella salivae DSM 15606]
MEKETYTPRHTIRNIVLANLFIYLLMIIFNHGLMIIWFFEEDGTNLFNLDLLPITLSFALAYPVGAAISWIFFNIDSWIKMAILQVFISNLIVFAICFLPSMDFDLFTLILLTIYFIFGGLCSIFVIFICCYIFRKSFED